MTYQNRYPWMTNEMRTRITTKNKLGYKVFLNPEDINLKNEYKLKRNRLISDLRNIEIDYYSNELEINKYDIKKPWKILRNIVGKNSDKNKQKNIFSINNKIISNSQVIAEEFNNFFVSIVPQLASNIYSSTNHMSYMNTVVNSIFIPDITTIEVINVILLLKNSCAG